MPPFPGGEEHNGPFLGSPTGGTLRQSPPTSVEDEFQERDIVRLLVLFGTSTLDKDGQSVGATVLMDIVDTMNSFDNSLYGKIAAECHALLAKGESFDQHYFLQHPDPAVTDLAIDLLSSPFEFSPNWEARWNYPLQNQPMPDLNFSTDMKQALDRFKLRKIQKILEINTARIRLASESGDDENMMHYMKIQQKLQETRNAIAARSGTVIIGKGR
jgi:DNA primase